MSYSGRDEERLHRMDWYPEDFLNDPDVVVMTPEQELAYRRLLDFGWPHGPLEFDLARLAVLARCSPETFEERVWKPALARKFAVRNGRIYNPRQERERELAERVRKAKRTGAQKANETRWSASGVRSDSDQTPIRHREDSSRPLPLPLPLPVANDPSRSVGDSRERSGEGLTALTDPDSIGGDLRASASRTSERSKKPPARAVGISESNGEAPDASACRAIGPPDPDLPGCELQTVPDPALPDRSAKLSPDRLADLWAEVCRELPQPKRPLASGIRSALSAAVKRDPEEALWRRRFETVAGDDWLSGKDEWKGADLAWAIGPKNTAKLDARAESKPRAPRAPRRTTFEESLERATAAAKRDYLAQNGSVESPPAIEEETTPW